MQADDTELNNNNTINNIVDNSACQDEIKQELSVEGAQEATEG